MTHGRRVMDPTQEVQARLRGLGTLARDVVVLWFLYTVEHDNLFLPRRTTRQTFGYVKRRDVTLPEAQQEFERYAAALQRWAEARAAYAGRPEVEHWRASHAVGDEREFANVAAKLSQALSNLQGYLSSNPRLNGMGGMGFAGANYIMALHDITAAVGQLAWSMGELPLGEQIATWQTITARSVEREAERAEKLAREGDRFQGRIYPYER
jgi:hypothetical protein